MPHAIAQKAAKDSTQSKRPGTKPHSVAPLKGIRQPFQAPIIQRKAGCACGGNCPRCQEEEQIQPNLKVNNPGDKYEQEAIWIANSTPFNKDADVPMSATPQRKSMNQLNPEIAPPVVHEVLRSPGKLLDSITRDLMESRFGHNFSDVRVHTDAKAAESAQAVNAQAYTVGRNIVFGAGQYAPGTTSGKHLLAHELTHIVQQRGTTLPVVFRSNGTETERNPLAGWQQANNSLLLLLSEDRMYIIPGGNAVYVPTPEQAQRVRSIRPYIAEDLGRFFEVPAAGAAGTRIIRAGERHAMVLDAGQDTRGLRTAVYLSQVQATMANLGVTELRQLRIIHVHQDHVSRIPDIVTQYGIRAQNVIIPQSFLIGRVNRSLRTAVNTLQNTTDANLVRAGFGPSWMPGTVQADRGGPGDIFRATYRTGDIQIESVALRSSLRQLATDPRAADRASYLTRITRLTDNAKVVILGDLRGSDLQAFRTAMEAQRAGSFNEFFRGVTTLSGFSHHVGAMSARDLRGIMLLLDATLLQTGRLRVVVQTNPAVLSQARADTMELMSRLGVELVTAEMPRGGGTSGAGATRDQIYSRGPDATTRPITPSALTGGLLRLARLHEARETLQLWRPLFEVHATRQEVDREVQRIGDSIRTLRQSLRTATEAAMEVRTGGATTPSGARDYSATGGARGATYQAALSAIPATTPAETALGPNGFQALERLRQRPSGEIPLKVALHQAIYRGIYSDQAFRHILSQLDPRTRDSLLVGPRGGRSPQMVAFRRVTAEFAFRQSVLPSGATLSVAGMSRGRAQVARGLAGLLAVIELVNIGTEVHQTVQLSRSSYHQRNVIPFVRRLMFWQQLGVQPSIVGVDDGIFSGPSSERDYERVINGLGAGHWDAFYIEHTSSRPCISNADVIRMGAFLAHHIRNYDEFATLFLDSGQDAVTWHNPDQGGWENAEWRVRVGRFETSGSNRVVERWETHQRMTQMMRVFVRRIIANTTESLQLIGRGRPPAVDSPTGDINFGNGLARVQYRARLRSDTETSTVYVVTEGPDSRHLRRDVRWWSPPVFYVLNSANGDALVTGADYNTYAVLRGLETEAAQLYIGGYHGRTWVSRRVVGNRRGTVWIPESEIERM